MIAFFRRNRWLLARRASQALVLGLFFSGILKGTLASSRLLDTVPFSDPFVVLQSLAARHWPEGLALIGAGLLAAFYAVFGGRLYCAWVCPVNVLTDLALFIRRSLGMTEKTVIISRRARLWVLAAVLAFSAGGGVIAWEYVNPITMLHRTLLFGGSFGFLLAGAVFLLDLSAGSRTWCGHLCPVGAFYGLLGRFSLLRVSALGRKACDDCGDCYRVCPEPQLLTPALRGEARGIAPLIASADCTFCGRCIDVCAKDVFTAGLRPKLETVSRQGECAP
ncbi:MAG TPA: quinol dehydrogenase ferredoxin subunit NapH [Candidatus Sulfotelmatobacter sp.]|jgi:ferredoxin-type protein NapH|nr:quinol dehydrogenase ferredoxin subunit NapH [Candidatus Sulfotelmatobacter sp.]